jgi:hypothetical protein
VPLDVVIPGRVDCCTDERVVHQRREVHVTALACEQLLLAADGGLDCEVGTPGPDPSVVAGDLERLRLDPRFLGDLLGRVVPPLSRPPTLLFRVICRSALVSPAGIGVALMPCFSHLV